MIPIYTYFANTLDPWTTQGIRDTDSLTVKIPLTNITSDAPKTTNSLLPTSSLTININSKLIHILYVTLYTVFLH